MARLRESSSSLEDNERLEESSSQPARRVTSESSIHPSPAPSSSSDKENRHASRPQSGAGKRRIGPVAMSSRSGGSSSAIRSKKRKLQHVQQQPSQARHRRELEERVDKDFYDPDQDEQERRAVRKGMRDLNKELNDTRSELLKANSNGLVTIISRADEYFRAVKQTSDATIDSRTLVQAADLSYKRTNELTLGDSSVGIDVDDFVTKCLSFMRRGDGPNNQFAGRSGTQSQRRRRNVEEDGEEEEEEEEEGDEQLDWAHLGRHACFPHNSRPCVPSFLLGPLSVQKRTRQQTQRRTREVRANAANATRPQELVERDLDKQETANLTVICKEIERLLGRIQSQGWEACEKEQEEREDMTEDEALEMMLSHGISDDGCVPLFDFCVNPKSFGQTVENLFYISFLIKEGSVGLNFDGRGLPTLGCAGKEPAEGQQAKGSSRNQAVFALDFEMWEAIIESHGIKKSLIPHRDEEVYEDGVLGASGWYG